MTLRSIQTDADLQAYCQHFNCDESDIAAIKKLIERGTDFKVDVPETTVEDFILPHVDDGKGTLVQTLECSTDYDSHYQDMYCNMFGIEKSLEVRCERVNIDLVDINNKQQGNMSEYVDYISDEAHYNEFADNMKVAMKGYAYGITQMEENKPELTEEQKALILEKYKSDLKKLKGE